ncbi:mitochondrial carrier protein-like protein [Amylocarpus encephaloides]|uniref:Mitochondrial carrier protein-like protein n=1 Tax=Amylocarpus encephaloides TaxID=45428 RepID=A0A9P7YG00_9HELO|nr:mitochondrial carrier protein-like protein [Amylocarpus encephaloides]
MSNTHTDILLAGAIAAFTIDLLVYPLDTVKTRFQSPGYKKIYYDASKNAINRRLLFSGLYQGVGSVILITIPSSGAFFTTYEAVKSGLTKVNPILSGSTSPLVPQPIIHSVASSTAELIACFILTPAEVLKQNAQMVRNPARNSPTGSSTIFQPAVTLHALRRFKKPSQLWTGYTTLAARNLPFTAMQFPVFEHLKSSMKEYRKAHGTFTRSLGESALITSISAGSAGSVAAIITTPVDVVKTRIMLSAAGEGSEKKAKEAAESFQNQEQWLKKLANEKGGAKKGGLVVAREVLNESGIKGLFRGGTLRAAWTALGSGLYLGVYGTGRGWLGERREGGIEGEP